MNTKRMCQTLIIFWPRGGGWTRSRGDEGTCIYVIGTVPVAGTLLPKRVPRYDVLFFCTSYLSI
jgi:hypothetical protein